MRIFALSVVAGAIIAGVAYVSLISFQESTADAYTTGSARLDWAGEVGRLWSGGAGASRCRAVASGIQD